MLYDRQAPLLTWPETVQERFRKWGRKWPDNEDRGKVNLAIVDYIEAYKAYVDMVYKTCKPFDFETGEGIVVAPAEESLAPPRRVLSGAPARPRGRLVRSGTALDPAHHARGRRAGQQERQGLELGDHQADRRARGRQSRSPRISDRSPRARHSRKPP